MVWWGGERRWGGREEDLYHTVCSHCSAWLDDETETCLGPALWALCDGDVHMYYHVQIAQIFFWRSAPCSPPPNVVRERLFDLHWIPVSLVCQLQRNESDLQTTGGFGF